MDFSSNEQIWQLSRINLDVECEVIKWKLKIGHVYAVIFVKSKPSYVKIYLSCRKTDENLISKYFK